MPLGLYAMPGSLLTMFRLALEGQSEFAQLAMLCLFSSIILALFCKAIYNLWFHPLRRFPGPFFGRLTDFHHTYLLATRNAPQRQWSLHQKFGPIVRIAPNLLSVNAPELLPTIYNRHADKTSFYSPYIAGEQPALLQIREDDHHATCMRLLSPAYSLSNLRLLENSIDGVISTAMGVLKDRFEATDTAVDMASFSRWYVYDTMTEIIYGKAVGMLDKCSDVDGLIAEWHRMFPKGGLLASLPWLFGPIVSHPWLKPFLMPNKGHKYGSGHVMNCHEKLFNHRKHHPCLAHPGNLFDRLLQTKDSTGSLLSNKEAERECFILTIGAQDTNSSFISAFIRMLLQHRKVYTKLQKEVDDIRYKSSGTKGIVSFEETNEMPYFQACIYETLRIRPPVSLALPRHAPTGGLIINDTFVPESAELASNSYVIHRNQSIFGRDADFFRPSRWIDGDKHRLGVMKRYFFAFGYGSRRCLGRNIALFTAQKYLIQLLRTYEIQLPSSDMGECRVENYGIDFYFDLFVKLKPREQGAPLSPEVTRGD